MNDDIFFLSLFLFPVSFLGLAYFRLLNMRLVLQIASERSILQLAPDGESLVLLNSIKIPCCR